jgi:intracellular multiplication protein IcmL
METRDPIILVLERNQFYRRQHFLALGVFLLTWFINFFLMFVLYYLHQNPTEPLYFATDDQGRLIPVVPVTQPNMSADKVMAWTINAVQLANSYDYVNYRQQLQDAQKYFTIFGWGKYMDAIQANNNLVAVTQRKMIGVATIVGQPKIVTQGILNGAYAWKFEMPMLVTYYAPPYDETSKFSNPIDVSVIVQRQSLLQGYQGLGIVQMVETISNSSQPAQISNVPNS